MRGSRMKERRSFSFGCAKIHELPISVFLLSFSVLAGRCQSCLVVRRPAARRQSRRVRSPAALSLCVVRSHRVDRSLASSGRLSCSVVCVISSCVVPLLGVSRLCARRVSRVPFSFLFRLDG